MSRDLLVPPSFHALVSGRLADPQLAALVRTDRSGMPSPASGDDWLRALPRSVEQHLDRWGLRRDETERVRHGECALVVPVTRQDGTPASLKLTWPHAEARHEHLALRRWGGRGAVRLLAADPVAGALLLERLDPGRELRGQPLLEACEVIGQLFRALDRPALPQLDTVAWRAARWQDQLRVGTPLVPRRLTEQASTELTQLIDEGGRGRPGEDHGSRLVHEDLHDLNVLAPRPGAGPGAAADADTDHARGAWLAIDPKPVAGEWAYAVAPIVWNRPEEAARAHHLRTHARLRADVVTEAAGLDPDRVRAWTFVRLVLGAVWASEHAPASDPFRARMIALAKAFTD